MSIISQKQTKNVRKNYFQHMTVKELFSVPHKKHLHINKRDSQVEGIQMVKKDKNVQLHSCKVNKILYLLD